MEMAKFNILFKCLTVYIVFDIKLNVNTKCIRGIRTVIIH